MSGPAYKGSQIKQEAQDWLRQRTNAEGAWIREQQWCQCRRPVLGGTYMRQRVCVLCGKLRKTKG